MEFNKYVIFFYKLIKDSSNVIINVTGDISLSLLEVEESFEVIKEFVKRDVNTIYSATINENLKEEVIVTIIVC